MGAGERRTAWILGALVLVARREAVAQERQVDFRADEVTLDARSQKLEARGNVQVSVPPFHLSSDRVLLHRSHLGVVVEGEGELGFCPCLGTPLSVGFDGATVAPPHDVMLTRPRLRVFGVPVLWAPWIWLRSTARFGLLPPEVAYRGQDGVFLGGGVHVPWRAGTRGRGLDLRAGAYLKGGVATEGELVTDVSFTRVRWDHLDGDGLAVDARGGTDRGATRPHGPLTTAAWDADVLHGQRGVRSTTNVDVAARPFDRATGEVSLRDGGWTIASSLRAVNVRGVDTLTPGAFGPVATVRRAESLGNVGAYDFTVEGGAIRAQEIRTFPQEPAHTLGFVRGEAGSLVAARVGAVGGSLSVRGAGDAASDGTRSGFDGAGSVRARIGLPLVRAFDSGEPQDPWLHRVEPRIEAGWLGARTSGVLADAFGRGTAIAFLNARGTGWVTSAGLATSLGRRGTRDASEIVVSTGWAGDERVAHPLLRGRGSLDFAWLGASAEGASVYEGTFRPEGYALVARARVGPRNGLHVGVHTAGREGIDPVLARALTDAPLEPTSGFLSASGWTGGARVAIPWGRWVQTRGGADVDFTSERLVAASGSLELRDPCGCLIVRLNGSHRVGREGVDVWLTVDLPPR